jgi:type 1 fimbria pilin
MDRKTNRVCRLGKVFWVIAGGLVSLIMAMPAVASCSVTGVPSSTITLPPNISIPRNAAPGQVLWDSNWVQSTPGTMTCNSPTDAMQFGYGGAGRALVPGFNNVYTSGIPGIGLKAAVILAASPPGDIDSATVLQYPLATQTVGAGTFNQAGYARIQYIVTGPISTGTTNFGLSFGGILYGSPRGLQIVLVNAKTSTVTAQACSVQTAAPAVRMAQVAARELNSVGATAGHGSFTITLNCPIAVNAAITFTDVTDPTNRTSNLNLSTDSTASGVAYQILQGSQLVAYGPDAAEPGTENQIILGAIPGSSSKDLPFSVRYVRTGPLKSGSANAKATFTMSYQ